MPVQQIKLKDFFGKLNELKDDHNHKIVFKRYLNNVKQKTKMHKNIKYQYYLFYFVKQK